MAITDTTFDDLTESERRIAYAVYNKFASSSIDFKAKVLSDNDNVLMISSDGKEAGYRTFSSLAESVKDNVVTDYGETVERLNALSSRAFERTIGNGGRSYSIVHGLNSENVVVQLWGNGIDLPFWEARITDENTLAIQFEEDIPTDSVSVVIQSNKYSL